MNKTELKAFNWLTQQGYAVHAYESPDIVASDGKGYEVKLLRGNTITFSHGQLAKLREYPYGVDVLVFRKDDNEPYKIFSISELFDGARFVDGVNVIRVSSMSNSVGIPMSDDEAYLVKLATISSGKRPAQWVREALLNWVRKEAESGELANWISKEMRESLNKKEET